MSKCLCKQIINGNITYDIALKCKQDCNFCKYNNELIIYRKLNRRLNYKQIKGIFGWSFIQKHNLTETYLLDIINDGETDEINYLIDEYDSQKLFKNIIILMKHYNYSKKTNVFYIFMKLLSNQNLANEHLNEIVDMFIDASKFNKITLETWNLHRLENKDVSILNKLVQKHNEMKIIPVRSYCYYKEDSDKQLEIKRRKELIKETIDAHFNTLKTFFVTKNILAYINANYTYEKKMKIVEKIINIYQYLNSNIHIYGKDTNKIAIDPSNIVGSLQEYLKSRDREYIINELCARSSIYIVYMIDGKRKDGYDATGLTKELYNNLIDELLTKYTEEIDGYRVPNSSLTEEVWLLIGIFLGRALLIDKIKFALNLHPVICYLILNKGAIKNFDKIYDELCIYDIEYIKNLQKINLLNDADFNDFVDSFNDESDDESDKDIKKVKVEIDKNKYLCNFLFEKYIKNGLNNIKGLINGYMSLYSKMLYAMDTHGIIIRTNNLYMSITEDQTYNLNQLNDVLNVGSDDKMSDEKKLIFKNTFIELLKEIYKKDVEKLKAFFKFWFGNYMIMSFYDMNPPPYISIAQYNNYFGCFGSATCFNTLKISKSDLLCNRNHLEFLRTTMNKSLINQELSQAAGMYMQLE